MVAVPISFNSFNKTLTSLGIDQVDIVRQGYVPLALAKKLAK